MNKHTPGPWVVYTNPVTGSHVIGQTDGPPIVKLKAGQVSNAHLIAAAPAMYAALSHAAMSNHHPACKCKGEYSANPERYCTCHVQKAKAALAQAEGKL